MQSSHIFDASAPAPQDPALNNSEMNFYLAAACWLLAGKPRLQATEEVMGDAAHKVMALDYSAAPPPQAQSAHIIYPAHSRVTVGRAFTNLCMGNVRAEVIEVETAQMQEGARFLIESVRRHGLNATGSVFQLGAVKPKAQQGRYHWAGFAEAVFPSAAKARSTLTDQERLFQTLFAAQGGDLEGARQGFRNIAAQLTAEAPNTPPAFSLAGLRQRFSPPPPVVSPADAIVRTMGRIAAEEGRKFYFWHIGIRQQLTRSSPAHLAG